MLSVATKNSQRMYVSVAVPWFILGLILAAVGWSKVIPEYFDFSLNITVCFFGLNMAGWAFSFAWGAVFPVPEVAYTTGILAALCAGALYLDLLPIVEYDRNLYLYVAIAAVFMSLAFIPTSRAIRESQEVSNEISSRFPVLNS